MGVLITTLFERIKQVRTEYGILRKWIFTDGNGGYVHAENINSYMTRLSRTETSNSKI